jgi:nucleoside-diphosphate-sugar epimerase
VIGLSHLVNLSEETGIPLIQISTREVIGVRDFRVDDKMKGSAVALREVSESEPCFPLHSYGKTKLIGEFLMQGCMHGSVIRLNTCYTDEVQNGGGLVANLVRRSRQDSQVTLDNDGLALRDPLHIADLTTLILSIYDKRGFGEIFHAGGGGMNIISLREICTLANVDVQINSGSTNNDYGFVMDIRKAQGLGWHPKTNFRTWITQN